MNSQHFEGGTSANPTDFSRITELLFGHPPKLQPLPTAPASTKLATGEPPQNKHVNSRYLLTLLQTRQLRKPMERLNAKRPREQGFSLAVVLVSMLAVLVSSVALANRTQTGLVTASVSGSNREAREVADAGVTYVISEWNRPENRGMYTALEPMTSWGVNNNALKNPCRTDLNPTASATSALSSPINLGENGSNNRRFQVVEILYRGENLGESFTVRPGESLLPTAAFKPTEVTIVVNGTYLRGGG